ncbi:MAG: hypothetical protein U5L76_02475 [Patescibacteria group bacterium]|nr:hypothetical protein [Patescibacteria group bacterium]
MTKNKYHYYLKFINISLGVLGFLILFWLVNKNYALTGSVTYTWQPEDIGQNNIINLDTNDSVKGLLDEDNELKWYQNTDNLKFTAKLLRNFDQVSLEIFLDNISQPDIELLAQGGVEKGEYRAIIRNKFLDNLNWPFINNTENELKLWQRPNIDSNKIKQYQSVDNFLKDENQNVGIIGIPKGNFYHIPNYESSKKVRTIKHYFRGSHTLYTYIDNEKFSLSFDKIDLNRKFNGDILNFRMYLGDQLVYTQTIKDDGEDKATNENGPIQKFEINKSNLETGLYRLEIDANEDILFGNLKTFQKYFYFNSKIFLADGPEYFADNEFKELNIKTNSERINFVAIHEDALDQKINLNKNLNNNQNLRLKNANEEYYFEDLTENSIFSLAKADIYITGKDFIFEEFDYLPQVDIYYTTEDIENNLEEINYVLAKYQPKDTFGDIIISENYNLDNLMKYDDKIYFNLRMPGLYSHNAQVKIDYIKMKLEGQPLNINSVINRLKTLIKKIF